MPAAQPGSPKSERTALSGGRFGEPAPTPAITDRGYIQGYIRDAANDVNSVFSFFPENRYFPDYQLLTN